MSKLDEILFEHRWHGIADFHIAKDGDIPEKTKHQEQAKQQIKELIKDLVRSEYHYMDTADELLAKVIKKVEEL